MSDYVTPPGGMTFHLIFDAAADAAPASFRDKIEQAAQLLSQAIANPITVNIKIDYSGRGGSADAKNDGLGTFESYEPMSAAEVLSVLGATVGSIAPGVGTVLGGLLGGLVGSLLPGSALPSNFRQNIRQDLIKSSSSNPADSLPSGTNFIQGWPFVWVTNTQLKLFGLSAPNDATTDDASAHFNTDIDPSALVGIALHELTHALGRVPLALGLNLDLAPSIFDLFRFTSPGQRLFNVGNPTAPASYFSLDGGVTKLADYGTTNDPSDFFNHRVPAGVQGGADAFNEDFISLNTTPPTSSTNQFLSSLDLQQLEAIGFNVRRPTPPHLKFNITYDPSVDAAPAAFKTEVEAVAKHFEGLFLDPVTINLTVKFNPLDPNVLGQSQPSSLTSFSYNTIRAALANKAGSADDATAALLATDPISGAHNYLLPTAEQKALGLLENYPSPDGTVTFSSTANFDYSGGKNIAANSYDFTGVVADEFSQIMGRTMDVGTTDANFLNNVGVANNVPSGSQYPGFPNSYTLLDLYHYSAPGTRVFTQTPGYFSIDGGNTNLNNFDATAGDDPGNWAATVHNDAFGVSVSGHTEPVTPVDLRELGILGWDSLSNVSKAAELSTDIKKIDLASQATGGDGTDYIITLAPGATLTEAADLFAVNLAGNDTLTIDGQGATLDGGGAHRGLFVYAGNVTIESAHHSERCGEGRGGRGRRRGRRRRVRRRLVSRQWRAL